MLNRKIFEDGLSELEVIFNFSMTKERAEVWYKYSKHLEDSKWQKKISACIKGCRKVPTLADILDIKGYYYDNDKIIGNKLFEPEKFIRGKGPSKEVTGRLNKLYKKIGYIPRKERRKNGSN